MRAEVYEFKNSESCSGFGIASTHDRTHDIITITGSYPEPGMWAQNLEAREEVLVVSGVGEVALRGVGVVGLDSSDARHSGVVIEPGQWFRWRSEGGMTISMVCEPGFDAEKYQTASEEELRK